MTTATDYMQRTQAALERGMDRASQPGYVDLAKWPEDVRGMITTVCNLWHMRPPATKSSKALWIRDARELIDAAGEWGVEAVREYRVEFEAWMSTHRGVAFHTVSGPGSLVKMVRDRARRKRETVEGERMLTEEESTARFIASLKYTGETDIIR